MRGAFETRRAYEHAQFAALRSLLQSTPGPEAWPQVCKLAQAWRGEAFEQVERYIEDHIQGWPDERRTLPKTWRTWIARGEDVPQARLVRRLGVGDSYRPDEAQRMVRLRRVLECSHLSQITHLSIDGLRLGTFDEAVALVQAFVARQEVALEHVELFVYLGYGQTQEVRDALYASWDALLGSLPTRTLTASLPYHDSDITAFQPGTPLAERLEALTISSWSLTEHMLAQLTPERLPHLKHIRLSAPNVFWSSSRIPAGRKLIEDPRLDPEQRDLIAAQVGVRLP